MLGGARPRRANCAPACRAVTPALMGRPDERGTAGARSVSRGGERARARWTDSKPAWRLLMFQKQAPSAQPRAATAGATCAVEEEPDRGRWARKLLIALWCSVTD